ncbi:MAG: hypothetical protein FVQ79_05260 [Planctomycetes bacterium]|nr:hypothetical protein [Planctomycetota bacterium]
MDVKYKIISAKDFIKADPNGECDLAHSKKILVELAAVNQPPADYEILMDFRHTNVNTTVHLSFWDVVEFAKEFCRHREAFRNKVAFLCRNDKQLDRAKFAQLFTTNRGFRVAAFISFEEAIDWLADPQDIE